jgi:hypothetical protein
MSADEQPPRQRNPREEGLMLVVGLAAVMWVVEVVDAVAFNLDSHGIEPREVDGLPGIVFAPFLHAGFGHLIGNTIPFLLLGGAIALAGLARVAAVTAIVVVVGGLGTWFAGPADTVHRGERGRLRLRRVPRVALLLDAPGARSRRGRPGPRRLRDDAAHRSGPAPRRLVAGAPLRRDRRRRRGAPRSPARGGGAGVRLRQRCPRVKGERELQAR